MTTLVEGLKTTGALALTGAGAFIFTALAPLVSCVALPIFTLKAIPLWIEHRSLYHRTLTDGTRAKFGRIAGQDYTRWDGKAITLADTSTERLSEAIGTYVHGCSNGLRVNGEKVSCPDDCPFKTQADLEWLEKEFTRREKKDLLDSDLKMMRACAKALIPLVGLIWVIFSETAPGSANKRGCDVYSETDPDIQRWDWREAIRFHQQALTRKLSSSTPF